MDMTVVEARGVRARSACVIGLFLVACGGSPTEETRVFAVGGMASGLVGAECILVNNGGDKLALSADGPFSFSTRLAPGSPYTASILRPPIGPHQDCTMQNSSGTVSDTDVTDIAVNCVVRRPPCSERLIINSVSGDEGVNPTISTTGRGEVWVEAGVIENSFSSVRLSAHVLLDLPAGVDYDLYVYCFACAGGGLAGVSQQRGPGLRDSVAVRWEDRAGLDDSGSLVIRVRYVAGSSAEPWTLRIRGNQPVSAATCTR